MKHVQPAMLKDYAYTYDELGRLKSVSAKGSGGTVINNFAYTYDLAGQRTQEAGTTGIRNYTYDEKRQLTGADGGAGYQYGYDFDPIGNRLTSTNSGAVTSYLPNNVNQYSSISLPTVPQSVAPVYDNNGNMTANGKGMTLDYDEENRLKSVSSNFQSQIKRSEFVYDGLGRRVERKEYLDGSLVKAVRYIYDDKLPVQELESTDGVSFTSARHYTRGLDLSQTLQGAGGIGGLLAYTDGSGSYYYSTDGNGNVTDLVDGGGVIAAHYEYSPFGEKTATSGPLAVSNPYQWSSKEYHQESGLVYYLYRYYDSDLGRWVNRDPIEENGGLNMYLYVRNSPVVSIDPLGLLLRVALRLAPEMRQLNPMQRFQPAPPLLLNDPNNNPDNNPDSKDKKDQEDDSKSDIFVYRGMVGRAWGLLGPETGENARKLGVRPGIDIEIKNGKVWPNTGGMSVAPLTPYNLPAFRRPVEWKGTDKDPNFFVWEISISDIDGNPKLKYNPDSPTHGVVSPKECMPYDEYKKALESTRGNWQRISPYKGNANGGVI